MGIAEFVPEDLERETDEAIARAFKEMNLVVVPASGGKDSSVIMQKCLRYKIENPDCQTDLVVGRCVDGEPTSRSSCPQAEVSR